MIRTAAFDAYSSTFKGGVRVAVGDVDPSTPGDEIVTAPGPGAWSRVRIWSLNNGLHMIKEFDAYAGAQNGVYLAVANIDGTGPDEIVAAPGPGGGSVVRVYRYASGSVSMAAQFASYAARWSSGVRVTAGDYTGDGKAEIATVTGKGDSTPYVRIFTGTGGVVRSFTENPGTSAFYGGAFLGSADVDGDHKAELIVSYDAGARALVKELHEATSSVLHTTYYAFGDYMGGVRTSGFDWNADGRDEMIAAVGKNGNGAARVYGS
jgi:hypothetical protein